MSAGTSTQSELLREWSPNHRVFEALAKEAGRFRSISALTAIDADPDYLALANDLGHLYWYNRKTDSAIKLRVENSRSPICCVKIVSTVDYMVACGHKNGHVNVFQLPKPHAENVPDHVKPKSNSQAQRFSIRDLHDTPITSLEWSKNGTKLFSGDENGVVILTEFDYYMNICKSLEIVNESYEIVQLSYYPNYLLVSCTFRCIICDYRNGRWNVNQVGKQDRRSLSKLGGTFHFNYDKPNDIHIYAARTGVRIWNSNFQGKVIQTLLFKDSILKPTSQVLLLNPPMNRKIFSLKDLELGPLYMFNEKYIVTHSDGILFILDPETHTTFATIDEFRSIISVSVTKREIFVLESDNCIVRLSFVPEDLTPSTNENRMTKSLMNPIQLAINTIKDIANSETKLYFSGTDQNDQIAGNAHDSSIPTYTDITSVVKAEECFELPPIKDLTEEFDDSIVEQLISAINDSKSQMCDSIEVLGTSPKSLKPTTSNDKKHVFNMIGNIEYPNDIVHSSKKTKKPIPTNVPITTDPQPCSSKCDNKNYIPITRKGFRYDKNLFPVKKSPETLEKEIRDNEEKLAKILNLEPVTICPIKPSSSKDDNVSASTENSKKYITYDDDDDDDDDTSNINIKKNNARFEKGVKKNQTELTPKCVTIPNVWNLQEIKIDPNVPIAPNKVEKCTENSSVFDADWELV